ncbi:hypothetical protein [uncultured Methanobrevibacter sp.]|uniref:hypothetical protein n=1 Tax=uncultured Methanobrevibacter sp. TaxID=253161 RepID=UPI0025D9DD8C|nr:hypothetical protein [uncultured Methanobrevibacter sp.]
MISSILFPSHASKNSSFSLTYFQFLFITSNNVIATAKQWFIPYIIVRGYDIECDALARGLKMQVLQKIIHNHLLLYSRLSKSLKPMEDTL